MSTSRLREKMERNNNSVCDHYYDDKLCYLLIYLLIKLIYAHLQSMIKNGKFTRRNWWKGMKRHKIRIDEITGNA